MALRNYLLANGLFSAFSGLFMLLQPRLLNNLFGITNPYVFPVIGINLLVFALFVFTVAFRYTGKNGLVHLISLLDVLWVVGSVAIIVFRIFDLTGTGYWVVGIVAIWVAFLAYKQYRHNTKL